MTSVGYWILQEHIKRESDKAYLIECPNNGNYARMQYWLSKKQVKKYTIGNFSYYSVWLPRGIEIKMSRFRGKRNPREVMTIQSDHLANLYYWIPNRIQMRVEFERRAIQADIEFEERMRTSSYNSDYLGL